MPDLKFYTVMELAEHVGVPRTTINDWLSKYSTYVDFSMQGKRRIYSENTLTLLLKISKLRSSGMASIDIEKELAKTCAIHPETEVEKEDVPPVKPPQCAESDQISAMASRTSSEQPQTEQIQSVSSPVPTAISPSEEYSLIARQQTDEITALLGERFRDILFKMDAMEEKARKNALRAWFFFAFTAIVIALLAAGGFLAWSFAMEMRTASVKKDTAIQSLSEQTRLLQTGTANVKEELVRLMKELPEQQKEFDRALKENRENYEKRIAAELAAEKERFAAQQLLKAKELEAASKRSEESDRLRREAEEKLNKTESGAKQLAAEQKVRQERILAELSELRKQAEEARKDREAKTAESKAHAQEEKPEINSIQKIKKQ